MLRLAATLTAVWAVPVAAQDVDAAQTPPDGAVAEDPQTAALDAEARSLFEAGETAFSAGRYAQAVRYFEDAYETGCDSSPNTEPCDDELFCNGADACDGGGCTVHAGDPCPGLSACDEGADTCTGCASGADCPDTTYGLWGACGGFSDTCDQTGERTRTVTTYTCEAGGMCMPSTTTGTGSCSRVRDGVTCESDGDRCTDDVCDGTGTCTHPPRPDGSQCTSEGTTGSNYRCCAGTCVNTVAVNTPNSNSHCGGCYVDCTAIGLVCNGGWCRTCGTSSDCHPGWICDAAATPDRCACNSDSDCPRSWQNCNAMGMCRGVE